MTLTPKQKRFVQEYLKDLNATAAAKRAGYSKKTAAVIGARTLKLPHVAKLVAAKQDARAKRVEHNAEWVLAEVAKMAASNFHDHLKLRALELLGKHYGMFKDTVAVLGVVRLRWDDPNEEDEPDAIPTGPSRPALTP